MVIEESYVCYRGKNNGNYIVCNIYVFGNIERKVRVVMRLTKELPMGSYIAKKIYLEPNRNEQECIYKLGQLEDIEDELGIDLTLRHKIETSEKLYCRSKGEIVESKYQFSYGKIGVGLVLPMNVDPYYCVALYDWKDYGKTWALTKEELL